METSRICLDTDVIIDYLRHRQQVVSTALLQFDVCLTSISLFELETADFLSERQRQLLTRLYSIVTIVPFDELSARRAALVRRTLQTTGQGIGLEDTLIAGICLAQDLPLLTRNVRHFRRVPHLRLVTPDDLLAVS